MQRKHIEFIGDKVAAPAPHRPSPTASHFMSEAETLATLSVTLMQACSLRADSILKYLLEECKLAEKYPELLEMLDPFRNTPLGAVLSQMENYKFSLPASRLINAGANPHLKVNTIAGERDVLYLLLLRKMVTTAIDVMEMGVSIKAVQRFCKTMPRQCSNRVQAEILLAHCKKVIQENPEKLLNRKKGQALRQVDTAITKVHARTDNPHKQLVLNTLQELGIKIANLEGTFFRPLAYRQLPITAAFSKEQDKIINTFPKLANARKLCR